MLSKDATNIFVWSRMVKSPDSLVTMAVRAQINTEIKIKNDDWKQLKTVYYILSSKVWDLSTFYIILECKDGKLNWFFTKNLCNLIFSEMFYSNQKIKLYCGGAGYRSRYLSHAKRALYHLSYAPVLGNNPIIFWFISAYQYLICRTTTFNGFQYMYTNLSISGYFTCSIKSFIDNNKKIHKQEII